MTDPSAAAVSSPDPLTTGHNAPRRTPGRLALLSGLGLAIMGIIAYVLQIRAHRLTAPWYMPVLATLGVVLVVVALQRARNVWRFLALGLVVLLAAAEWTFLLSLGLPKYTGPVAEGKLFPAFQTSRADGTTFNQSDLAGAPTNVFVFFRGRW